MEAFFGGLDSRLRASVKVADSIMMGLVNAAMEDAYKKSLCKDGDLERLVEKLRFCELATMQLEWCLRFVRGEMENSSDVENADGHGQLVDDLLETRDRIQARLDEAELAVTEMDREYARRQEAESRMRLALELKCDQLSSSRCEAASACIGPNMTLRDEDLEEGEGRVFGELKGSVDRQMLKLSGKLEDARHALIALMQKAGVEASPMARLDSGHDSDAVSLSGFYSMAQLQMELQEMVADAGAMRESIASSCEMTERSISLLRTALDEQQWAMKAEEEMCGAVLEGFLKEINVEPKVHRESSFLVAVGIEWSALMDDMKTLQDELETLVSRGNTAPMADVGTKGTNDLSIQENPLLKNDESCEDRPEEQLATNLIRDHETILVRKNQESNLSKIEPNGEKALPYVCNGRSFNKVKESASLVIARLNVTRSENAKLFADNTRSLTLKNAESSSEGFESQEKETRLTPSTRRISEKLDSRQCYPSDEPGVSREEIEKLIEEKTDSDIKCEIQDAVYTTMFGELARRLTVESTEHFMATLIKDEVHKALIAETLNEWKSTVQAIEDGRLIQEETDCIVFVALIKELMLNQNLSFLISPDKERTGSNLGRFSIIDNIDRTRNMKMQINDPREDKGVDLNQDPKLVKPKIFSSSDNCDSHNSNQSDLRVEMLTDKDDAYDSANAKVEQALEQQDYRKLQIRDEVLSLSMPLDRTNLKNDQVDLILDEKHDASWVVDS